jgi:cob(I)alamin adenosyltransferase
VRQGNGGWEKGCVQVYTGDGKGKTTAALGLAVRAAGAGLRVFFGQLCKGRQCSEHVALKRFADLITVRQFGRCSFVGEPPAPEDVAAAQRGLAEIKIALTSGDYDVIIVDEANAAVHWKLLEVQDLLDLIEDRPERVELVLTGRHARPEVIARANLVTEMREVKHPWQEGLGPRRGIEE